MIKSAPWLAPGEVAGHWVAAGELEVGDRLRKADGATDIVNHVQVVVDAKVMYNLTVDQAHTYFVGDQQWLVHNACPTRAQIQLALDETIQPYLSRIRAVAGGDVRIGYRGSLARGFKGPHKGFALFDPTNFDVDAFIVSDALVKRIPFRNGHWGSDLQELNAIQQEIDIALRANSVFAGLRRESFSFRVWTSLQETKVFEADAAIYFLLSGR